MEPHLAPAGGRRRRGALRVVLCAVLAAAMTTGCGVRLATPPPAPPVPDAFEVVRSTAVSDALHVAESAEQAAETTRRTPVRTELERIAADARAQAESLGGEYDSGLEHTDTADPQVSPTEESTTAQDVVVALDDAAARGRAAADRTADGPLARLLASTAASWTVSAARLADLARGPDPARTVPEIPAPAPGEDPDGEEPGDEGPERSPSSTPEQDTETESAVSTTEPGSPETPVAPEGLTADELSALVVSEDAIGYALQLRAARADGELQERLLALSRTHRERAQAWAVLAGTDGTDQDPRRVAYAVPPEAEVPHVALVRSLENDLAIDYASLVGTSASGTRAVLVDLLVEASLVLDDWGARPSAFPGLPEQGATGT